MFGVYVNEVTQASYLTRAYREAGRHRQVKMLVWWTIRDRSSSGTYVDLWGSYMGLRAIDGRRKRSYYAFAGGNRLTLSAPASVAKGAVLQLAGSLTSSRMGALGGKPLRVERRSFGRWYWVANVSTAADGSYSVRFKPSVSALYRVRWLGVCSSPSRWVPISG